MKKIAILGGILFALWILIFTGIMITKVMPYMTFEYATDFLGTKTDKVLQNQMFRVAFYIHITSSIFAIGGGIFNFFPSLYRRKPTWHRLIGKVYIGSILLLAAPSGLVLAIYANGGLTSRVGFTLQCFVWWFVTFWAYQEGTNQRYLKHSEMMLRSFAVTLAAMSLRTESYFMYYVLYTKPIETYQTVTWLSWVGNLLIVEVLIRWGVAKDIYERMKKQISLE